MIISGAREGADMTVSNGFERELRENWGHQWVLLETISNEIGRQTKPKMGLNFALLNPNIHRVHLMFIGIYLAESKNPDEFIVKLRGLKLEGQTKRGKH